MNPAGYNEKTDDYWTVREPRSIHANWVGSAEYLALASIPHGTFDEALHDARRRFDDCKLRYLRIKLNNYRDAKREAVFRIDGTVDTEHIATVCLSVPDSEAC